MWRTPFNTYRLQKEEEEGDGQYKEPHSAHKNNKETVCIVNTYAHTIRSPSTALRLRLHRNITHFSEDVDADFAQQLRIELQKSASKQ